MIFGLIRMMVISFIEQQLTELTRAVTLEHVGDVAALPRGADEPPLPTNAVMQAALRKGAATVAGFSSALLFSLSLSRSLALSLPVALVLHLFQPLWLRALHRLLAEAINRDRKSQRRERDPL